MFYQNDFCQVYCGDCSLLLPKILTDNPKSIIVTDPPFNIGRKYNGFNDNKPEEEYYQQLVSIIKDIPSAVIHYPEALHKLSIYLKKAPQRIVSWVYPSNTPRQHRDIAFYDIVPDFSKCGQPYKNPTDKRIKQRIAMGKQARLYDWWEVNQVKNVSKDKLGFTAHSCIMPLEVMTRIVKILPDDYIVIDPFAGSGSTLLACQQLRRKSIGIEISKEYCDIIKTRLFIS